MTHDASDGFRTRSVHAGAPPDPATGARAPPIHQTTSYEFEDADHTAELYALRAEGDVYSRMTNPTVSALEARLASLEGGVGAAATGCGMAALDALTFVLAAPGDNVVASTDCYGGTTTYFEHSAGRQGVEPRFVETLDYDAYAAAIDDDTAFVHVETIGNPALVTPDFDRLAGLAHENGAPLVVDNTFATPYLCRPLEHGADLVWESTTKWLHGAGSTLGGVVVDGGSFPWAEYADDYPELAGESPVYEGIDFSERFDAPVAEAIHHRALHDRGGNQSPFDAWVTLQKLETLPLRMDRHCENAAIVAEYLDDHPEVGWVSYPGLSDHPTHDNASEYLSGGDGGVVTFGVGDDEKLGYEAGKQLCERTELASFLANVGDAKTLIIHPASTTHAQLSADEQRAAGVSPDMVRLSVGIEDPADVIADLDRAIAEATAT